MNAERNHTPYTLGLDIGVSSIGWALVGLNQAGEPERILRTGAHIFDAGVQGNVESGRDEARGAARRNARLPRRMFWRRQRRRRKILRILQRGGLLPPGDIDSPQGIHEYLLKLDAELRAKHLSNTDRVGAHVFLYQLRSAALTQRLQPAELGRAFYHLAQRRGFLSNRKSLKKDEDEGEVKQGISELQAAMDAAGAQTLGQYFATLDPEAERVRRRWTAREMYVNEFNRIFDAQKDHHPGVLTDEFRASLYRALFFQRPLKSSRHLIGRCELVPNARRAAIADRIAQRFRILQKVNDLEITMPDGEIRPLSAEQRKRVIDALCAHGDMTFAKLKAKAVLGLPKGATFNFEQRDEEKRLPGHRTDEKMRAVFGDAWDERTEAEREAIVLEVLSFEKPDALARRATKAWGLTADAARRLADTRLEQGYAAHSRQALRKLVAAMEDGTRYATARRALFPSSFKASDVYDRLPPIEKALPSLRNPAVARTLTELRKLVNAIVSRFGKPDRIRIELARDLKRARKERERKSREIDEQTKLREQARARILREMGIAEPRRSDVEKVLLAEECGWQCPYTGRQISMQSLLGAQPQFDVEHIIPFSRSLENSFLNKTLCYHEENRDRKRNRTPFEAYGADAVRYAEMIARVRRFQGKGRDAKLRRFEMTAIPEDFVSRQLNETRYASRLAADYLGLLYGGRADAQSRQRIQVSAGGLTAHLRNEWMLNSILDDGGQKTRDDHRHHAVDALVVALTGPAQVNLLQQAAERASAEGRRLFGSVQEPWPHFFEEARASIRAIHVSCRQKKRIAGDLHEDTNYSEKEYPFTDRNGKTKHVRHFRKSVEKLNMSHVDDIVDPIVRERVREWMRAQAAGQAHGAATHPTMQTGDGRQIRIRGVRLRKAVAVERIGEGVRRRYVKPGANHHTVIVATVNSKGQESRWEDYPVTRLEAYRRKSAGQPIVQRSFDGDRVFQFSLCANDYVIMTDSNGHQQLCRLLSISEGMYEFRLHCDARSALEARRRGSGARVIASANGMRKRAARKVRVTYLGEVVPAND